MNTNVEAITRIPVPSRERLQALPNQFGHLMIAVEFAIYDSLKMLCPDYLGGFWMFYRLSNGGFYMVPEPNSEYPLTCPNGYTCTMSADAAGITACLYAYSNVSMQTEDDRVIEAFHSLREWAQNHPEAEKIFAAID